jgi:hypothetical protein
METLLNLILAAVAYVVIAESSDRAVERELRVRQSRDGSQLRLVEDFDVRPSSDTWRHRAIRLRARVRSQRSSAEYFGIPPQRAVEVETPVEL